MDILSDIIDELRRDRKIIMSIKDPVAIKDYVEIDLNDEFDTPQKQAILQQKQKFKKELALNLSIIKVDYFYKSLLKLSEGKATCLDPKRFIEKNKILENRERLLKEQGIASNGHDDEMIILLNKNLTI